MTGVNDGDVVITSGQGSVIDGKPVEIQRSISAEDIAAALKQRYSQTSNKRKR